MKYQSTWLLLLVFGGIFSVWATDGKPLTVEDIMQFREIKKPTISDDGKWVTYLSQPDRGDGEAVAVRVSNGKKFRVERGEQIQVSRDGKWIAVLQQASAVSKAKAKKNKKKKLTKSLVLIEVSSGKEERLERVKSFAFSDSGGHLAIHYESEEDKDETDKKAKKKAKKKKDMGSPLELRSMKSGEKQSRDLVKAFAFAPKKEVLVWTVVGENGEGNGLFSQSLSSNQAEKSLLADKHLQIANLTFQEDGQALAFSAGWPKPPANDDEAEDKAGSEDGETEKEEKPKKPEMNPRYRLYSWSVGSEKAEELSIERAHWYLDKASKLTWSKDGKRLFFGLKPSFKIDKPKEKKAPFSEENFLKVDRILKDRGLDVWHGNDPFIKTYDKTNWKETSKRDYLAVYHLEKKTWVVLADTIVPTARLAENAHAVLLTSNLPYRRASTWNGQKRDLWIADFNNGDKFKVADSLDTWTRASLSPSGQYVVYYKQGDYHLYDKEMGSTRNLTAGLKVSFADEDHDYPSSAPGYGIAGWVADDEAVIIHDKYDPWVLPVKTGKTYCLTAGQGRTKDIKYRLLKMDPDQQWLQPGSDVWLTGFDDLEKDGGFFQATLGKPGVRSLLEGKKVFEFIAKAKDANKVLFTQEDFTEFPDLSVASTDFKKPKKLTDENPQIEKFAFGKPELVSWSSTDGKPLQGVLIKPGNYEPGKRYPVVVYYYRFFSQRMYQFNQMVINHRPNFPLYTSNGYAVFLPDIRFDVGLPGPAATKCLVPGVQKIIDMGIADPDAIGLHGHSWSGYQTAFVITQTNIFKAAVAGAPVSNMTSAYSGIRLGSGLARQFQYEMGQSRIGGSMWDKRDLYIENSPVFFADRIETPLLIQFGDIDEAVPWEQGIELYLAMRRLDKNVVFLQYREEPHHLKQYANKLDYTLKMKAFFDHYLKGEPAETWITHGVPYEGK